MAFEESSSITSHSSITDSGQDIDQFESTISSFLSKYPPDAVFLAAVSGGADSMAMLAALSAVAHKERLYCLHVEHGIRQPEESKGDADFVRDYCQKHGIECRVISIPPGKITSFARRKGAGIEAAARFFRRKALFSEAEKFGENARILIAHTKDDMLETALMRVLRGCGPAGLAAMPAENRVNSKEQRIILRPMSSLERVDVINYLKAKGISWREDSTNADEKFLRNRVRRQLVPLLNDAFPSWKTGISCMAETQSLAADFITEEAKKRISWNYENNILSSSDSQFPAPSSRLSAPSVSTNEEKFFKQPIIIREEALFLAIDEFLKSGNNMRTIKRSVLRQFCSGSAAAVDLGPARIRREGGKVLLSKKQKDFFESGLSLLI